MNILFTSVIGPYGVDSWRSRFKNPMSLLSNQVTRGQKHFTTQICNRTFAFDLFGANLNANVSVLNFPQEKHLKRVLRANKWDRIGISSIVQNFESLIETYKIVREIYPDVPIDIGGYIVNDELIPELKDRITKLNRETFHIYECKPKEASITFIKGDGLEFYSQVDGVGLKEKFYAPLVDASFGKKVLGLPLPGSSAGLMMSDIGCPMKCKFCATSHKFNGKFRHFLNSAEDLIKVANAQVDRGAQTIFVLSENFSLDTDRLKQLLKLMEQQKRPHKFNVFASANGLMKLGIENIVKLGINFIWIGLEDSKSTFKKTHGIDLKDLVKNLQDHGVEVLGSTILGFEHQDLKSLDKEVDYALSYSCSYNQFMLYMAMPGTELWKSFKEKGMLKNIPWEDSHGQSIQNWHHPILTEQELEKRLDRAFEQDFEVLGPSIYRTIKVYFDGYLKTRGWTHELVQMRVKKMKKNFSNYTPLLKAMYSDLKKSNHAKVNEIKQLYQSMKKEINFWSKIKAKLAEPLIYLTLMREKKNYLKSQLKRKFKDPKCSLTNYNFKLKVKFIKKLKTPRFVAIGPA